MSIHAVTVRVARIPLHTPYKVSGTVFHHFEPNPGGRAPVRRRP